MKEPQIDRRMRLAKSTIDSSSLLQNPSSGTDCLNFGWRGSQLSTFERNYVKETGEDENNSVSVSIKMSCTAYFPSTVQIVRIENDFQTGTYTEDTYYVSFESPNLVRAKTSRISTTTAPIPMPLWTRPNEGLREREILEWDRRARRREWSSVGTTSMLFSVRVSRMLGVIYYCDLSKFCCSIQNVCIDSTTIEWSIHAWCRLHSRRSEISRGEREWRESLNGAVSGLILERGGVGLSQKIRMDSGLFIRERVENNYYYSEVSNGIKLRPWFQQVAYMSMEKCEEWMDKEWME